MGHGSLAVQSPGELDGQLISGLERSEQRGGRIDAEVRHPDGDLPGYLELLVVQRFRGDRHGHRTRGSGHGQSAGRIEGRRHPRRLGLGPDGDPLQVVDDPGVLFRFERLVGILVHSGMSALERRNGYFHVGLDGRHDLVQTGQFLHLGIEPAGFIDIDVSLNHRALDRPVMEIGGPQQLDPAFPGHRLIAYRVFRAERRLTEREQKQEHERRTASAAPPVPDAMLDRLR